MHAELGHEKGKDLTGGVLTTDEVAAPPYDGTSQRSKDEFDDGFEYPTEEEVNTLRHVPYSASNTEWGTFWSEKLMVYPRPSRENFPHLHH